MPCTGFLLLDLSLIYHNNLHTSVKMHLNEVKVSGNNGDYELNSLVGSLPWHLVNVMFN